MKRVSRIRRKTIIANVASLIVCVSFPYVLCTYLGRDLLVCPAFPKQLVKEEHLKHHFIHECSNAGFFKE